MWLQIVFGFAGYKIYRWVFADDDIPDVGKHNSEAILAVSRRLEKIGGGKAYVGLRIPDPDTGDRQNIDIVLVTKKDVTIVSVLNVSGSVEVDGDGNWACSSGGYMNNVKVYPDPVAEITGQIDIFKLYLDQRGLTLPKGQLNATVVLPNAKCRVTRSIDSMPEVISFNKWAELKPEGGRFTTWIKGAFSSDNADGLHQKLHSILSTSPMWDRLELKGDKHFFGEFVEFKGKHEDVQPLKHIKRSKVSQITVQNASAFGSLGRSKVYLLCSPRNYGGEESSSSSSSESTEMVTRANVDVVFSPMNSKKTKRFSLSDVVLLVLGA